MPTRNSIRLTSVWPFFVDPGDEPSPWSGEEPSLTEAVACIVGIAAQRARMSGTLDALREAVEAALQVAPEPAESVLSPSRTSAGCPEAPVRSG